MLRRNTAMVMAVSFLMLGGALMAIPGAASANPVVGNGTFGHNSVTGNNLTMDNPLAAPAGPVVPHPSGSIVVTPVYNAFVSHNTTSSITNSSVAFPAGSFSRITVTFFDQYISNPFDDSFIVSVNGVQILAGNTLELENTSVTENITQYGSILVNNSTVFVTSPQFNPGYSSNLSVWFTFYNGTAAPVPNMVLPAFTNVNFRTPKNAFPNNVPLPFNVSRTTNVTFPGNVTSAYLNLYEQQNGNDEFWYTLQPPFREFRVFINDTLVATVQPYPNVQTGGGDLYLWQPILGIGATLYPPHMINLNPYLSMLHGKQKITVQVINDENLWIRAAANFMLTTSGNSMDSGGVNTHFSFSDHYRQSPATNYTSESIPSSAAYLNDSQHVVEVLHSRGISTAAGLTTVASVFRTVRFYASSSEFDPSFNIVQNTSFGKAIVFRQSFSMREIIQSHSSTSVFSDGGHYNHLISRTQSSTTSYYQINGTDIEYVVLNPFSVVIGFNVTQIKTVTTATSHITSNGHGFVRNMDFNYTSTKVTGKGLFDAILNSENTITSLTYNHAVTQKSVLSIQRSTSTGSTTYLMKEMAVNNSLVNRNGVIVYKIVKEGNGGFR